MKKISNHHDLVAEKQRLQQQLTLLKREMSNEILEIKEKLQPLTSIVSLIGRGVSASGSHPDGASKPSLLKMGANLGIDMLVGPRLAKAGWLARILVPPLLRGISSTVINKVRNLGSASSKKNG